MTIWGSILLLLAGIFAISFIAFMVMLFWVMDFIEAVMYGLGVFACLLGIAIGLIVVVLLVAWIGTVTGAFG
jgi:hypothetical protein